MGLSVVLELRHRLQLILGGVEDRVILRSWEKEETGMNTEITVFEKPIKRIRDLMGSRMAANGISPNSKPTLRVWTARPTRID
jgi:hypothetical protein